MKIQKNWILGILWGSFGGPLGILWESLGVLWGSLGVLGGLLGVLWEPGSILIDFLGLFWESFWAPKSMCFFYLFWECLRTFLFWNIARRAGETLVLEGQGIKIRSKTEAERREEAGSETGGFWDRFWGSRCGHKIMPRGGIGVLVMVFGSL